MCDNKTCVFSSEKHNHCSFCSGPCNPCSQSCGGCAREINLGNKYYKKTFQPRRSVRIARKLNK